MKSILKHLRLLPFVIAIGAGLLLVKGAGLVMVARAADAGATPPPAASDTTVAGTTTSADPAADDAETASVGEVDVLTSLAKRRATLDAREQDLVMQANLIAAAEKRVDDKIAQLKTLQTQVQTLMGKRDAAEQAQLTAIVKTYSSMKPKDAARIFNSLDDDVLLSVAQAMKPDVLGAIMANMQADVAQKLTVKLANRLKPPAPAPQQLAALTPPGTTPAATTPAAPSAQAPAAPASTPATAPSQTAPIPAPTKAATAPAAPAPQPAPQQTASNAPPQSPASTAPSTAAPAAAPAKK